MIRKINQNLHWWISFLLVLVLVMQIIVLA
jgi:hypothetical protein